MKRSVFLALFASLVLSTSSAFAGDEHWSRQFKIPKGSTKMGPGTGMSTGGGKPTVTSVAWHEGKLWMAGAWEPGISHADLGKRVPNEYWYLWTYSPTEGYEPVCYFHSAKGGSGPDGKILDFTFLPDGRLVVAGSFTRLDNPGGTRYHRVQALAIYDAKEPTANKWQPLGNFQYNGTVSAGGSIYSLAYDPQGNDLYVGGTFGGIRGVLSPKLHRYDFDTKSYEPVAPGVHGAKPIVYKIKVDTSTKPSTIYVAGKFHYTAGDGQVPAVSTSTAIYSTGFASFQVGKGWTTFPKAQSKEDESILQRAADFMHFGAVEVLDFLVDAGEIYIVGAFSEGKVGGQKLRGFAKWDKAKQVWVDPTGKGGVGREIFSIAKAENGKFYLAGAFGGRSGKAKFFKGFMNGDPAAMAMSFDPKTGKCEQLGSGLLGSVFPECRLAIDGNDVYFVGDFDYIGTANEKKKEWESARIARWNETIDFTKTPAKVAAKPSRTPAPQETQPRSTGNEHWSRAFPAPPRRKHPNTPAHTANTGMDVGTGTPDAKGMVWLGDTLYIAGSWQGVPNERWFVWTFNEKQGWQKLAYVAKGGKKVGPTSIPAGIKSHGGKIYVHGAIGDYNGVAVFDPATKAWSPFKGTYQGKEVTGHAMTQGDGPINDMAWDDKTGDLWMVGASGLENPDYGQFSKATAKVIRVDKTGAYHPMGYMLGPENPGKPIKVIESLHLDTTQTPTAVYIGGTFCYYGKPPTTNKRMTYNVARWDYEAKDWRPLGTGAGKARKIDAPSYPDGYYPGLPALPATYIGFLRTSYPRVRALITDSEGNLYAGGTLAVLDDTLPVKDRQETFGLARLDKKTNRWVSCTKVNGLSRDVLEMRWLDEAKTRLLLCGAFEYDNAWTPVNGVAILDTKTGLLEPLGGGLMREALEQVVAPMIVHAQRGSELWFSGLFDHAGVNANDRINAPIPSWYIAMWDPTKNLDPNGDLAVKPITPVKGPTGFSSVSAKVTLEAIYSGEGKVTWWEKRSNGSFVKKGQGLKFNANLRIKPGMSSLFYYVSVEKDGGASGGRLPVRIPIQ